MVSLFFSSLVVLLLVMKKRKKENCSIAFLFAIGLD
ncbi:hypothetical protein AMTRI_Chr07g79460 [Amborella trichopoda]